MARDWRLCIAINWNVDIPISKHRLQFIEISIFITAKPV
jgi:hypothetical protein